MKKRRSDQNEGAKEGRRKKVKEEKTEFSVAIFRSMLNDKTQRVKALEKFVACSESQEDADDIVKEFLQVSPECVEILKLLDDQPLDHELQLIFRCLEVVLLRTAALPQFHTPSLHLVQKLSHQHAEILTKTLKLHNNTSCVVSTLHLLAAMSSHGVQGARDVLRFVDAALLMLIGLLNRADRKDIRAGVIGLVAAFLLTNDKAVVLQLLHYKDLMRGIFKNLPGDHLSTIQLLLTTLRDQVVRSEFVTKTAKIHLFGNPALRQLSLLYNWAGRVDVAVDSQETSEGEQRKEGRCLVRQLVHDFLLELCCDFKNGINFHDKTLGTSGKNMNQVLHRFLLDLRQANRDPLLAQLVVRVLKACPDLLNRYLSDVPFSFSPRPSAQWTDNMALLTEIYRSQPDLSPVFDLPDPRPAEKVVSMVMVSAVPSVVRPVAAQGIKHADPSVRATTCALLVCVLQRSFKVICHCQDMQLWTDHPVYSVQDMERVVVLFCEALAKMLPDINTIISAWQASRKQDKATKSSAEPQTAVLSDVEGILHVLRLYQQVLPDHFLQSNYDFGKLLHDAAAWVVSRELTSPWLHVVNILGRLPKGRIRWHKEEKGLRTACYQLMQVFSGTSDLRVAMETRKLLVKVLGDTGLFDHTLAETELWLRHLRLLETLEERDHVLMFLDKVLTRGVRNPYPFADKVAEMTIEASTFTAGEVSSTEHDLEAAPDLNSSPDDEDILEDARQASSSLLPFSAFVPALLEDCRAVIQKVVEGTVPPAVVNDIHGFLTPAILDLLYSQTDPVPLCLTLRQHLSTLHSEAAAPSSKLPPQPWISDCNTLAQTVSEFLPAIEAPRIETLPCAKLVKQLQKDFAGGLNEASGEARRGFFQMMKSLDGASLEDVAEPFLHFCLKTPDFLGVAVKLARSRRLPEPVVTTLSQSCKVVPIATILFQSTNRQFLHQQDVKDAVVASIKLLKDSEFVFSAKCVLLSLKREVDCLSSPHTINNIANHFMFLREILKASREVQNQDVGEEQGMLEDVETIILKHPTLTNWFLKPKTGDGKTDAVSDAISEEICETVVGIMHHTHSESTRECVRQFIDKNVTELHQEIRSSQKKNKLSENCLPLKMFSRLLFCAEAKVVKEVVEELSKLRLSVLLGPKKTSSGAPSLHLCGQVLVSGVKTLLGGTGEQVSCSCFQQLLKLLQATDDQDLKTTVLKLLETQSVFPAEVDAKILESCLQNPTESSVEVAALLVEQSLEHRVHLQQFLKRQVERTADGREKLGLQWRTYLPVLNVYFRQAERAKNTAGPEQMCQVSADRVGRALYERCYQEMVHSILAEEEDTLPGGVELVAWLLQRRSVAMDTKDLLEKLIPMLSSPDVALRRWRHVCDLLEDLSARDVQKKECDSLCSSLLLASWQGLTALWRKKKDTTDDLRLLEREKGLLENLQKLVGCVGTDSVLEDSESVWAKFVKTGLRYNLGNSLFLKRLRCLATVVYQPSGPGRSLPAATLYQLIWSHSHFLSIIMARHHGKADSDAKGDLVELLLQLLTFDTTSCTSQHVPVLLGAYEATLSRTDQTLLCILHVYEEKGLASAELMPWLWGESSVEHHRVRRDFGPLLWQQPGLEDVLKLVEKEKMQQSALNFPVSRSLKPQVCDVDLPACEMYDPCFFLPLFASVLTPECVVDCRRFVESHCLGFALAGLASNDADMRAASYHVLSLFYLHLEGARFAEKRQLLYLLQCLQNGLRRPNLQVPNIVALFLARTTQLLLHPDDHMYPLVFRYLLVRPDLDLKAIPEFHILFFSTSMEFKMERSWILTLLSDGLRDKQDFLLYKNKSVSHIALSFYQSPLSDQHSKSLVMTLLQKACSIPEAAESLCQDHGLLSWLHELVIRRRGEPSVVSQVIQLLHSLWATLLGKPRTACADSEVLSEIRTAAQTQTTLSPQLAQEFLLVCDSIGENLG